MNFYFSLNQLIDTVDGLEQSVRSIASRALRISPRDALANRELLERCDTHLGEVKRLLQDKTHISRTALNKVGMFFEVMVISHRRMVNLAGVVDDPGLNGEGRLAVIQLLALAQKHYRTLVREIAGQTGIPVVHQDAAWDLEPALEGFSALVQEAADQQKSLNLLERALKSADGDIGWMDPLQQVRRELLEAKKVLKKLNVVPAVTPKEWVVKSA